MENTNKPLARLGEKVKQNWKRILIVFTFILVCLSAVIAVICPQYQIGFQYWKDNTNELGITQIENFDALILRNYVSKLQGEGYEIASGDLDNSISSHWGIFKKEIINQDELKEKLINNINIDIYMYKLIIPNDEMIYYFKNENECKDFINKVKTYNSKLEVEVQKTIGKIEDISSGDILTTKLNKLEEIKQAELAKQKAAAAKKRTVTVSRSNYKRSNYNIIASYVYISSYYGMRKGKMHTGVDLAASQGTCVYAWKAGKVKQASWNSQGYGKFIIIEHDDGTTSRYAHLSGYEVSKDDIVTQGQLIGYVGSTGNSTGPHLHFEILVNGNFVNPLNYL